MRFDIVTTFPKLISSPLEDSMLKRAQTKGIIEVFVHDLRQYTTDKHHQVDDYPYGGGPGMVLKPEPFFLCLDEINAAAQTAKRQVIFLSPQGKQFNQSVANDLANWEHLILLCGHYKGVDERVIEALVDEEFSVGDYVLTGGELPALIVLDAVSRLLPGVLNDLDSANTDSFQNDLLDCPYYTRPEEYRGMKVPEVLLSGNHRMIQEWRYQQSLKRTQQRRNDLFMKNRNFDPHKTEETNNG